MIILSFVGKTTKDVLQHSHCVGRLWLVLVQCHLLLVCGWAIHNMCKHRRIYECTYNITEYNMTI